MTPDSFYDGGKWVDTGVAIARGRSLFDEGADVVDVGGESTRPGAHPVDAEEEFKRVIPVVEVLAGLGRVSIDTTKSDVAAKAINAGASLVNDVSSTLGPVAAEHGVGWVAMHMKGNPRTMQQAPTYSDVVEEVRLYLEQKVETAKELGINEVWIDPGIGFGKTVEHNLLLLRHIAEFVRGGIPVVVGASRKSFLGHITGDAPVDDRLAASLTSALWCAQQGVGMIRVHDVKETIDALDQQQVLTEQSSSGGTTLVANA